MKPFTKYGWSKLGGECAVQMYDNHLILRMAMNRKPFPHPKALKDMRKSIMYIEDAAKVTLKLLNEKGIINYEDINWTRKNFDQLFQIGDVIYVKKKKMAFIVLNNFL